MAKEINVLGFFIAEKTSDVFLEVEFQYEGKEWKGLLPKFLQHQGLDLTDDEFDESIVDSYSLLDPSKREQWIISSDSDWTVNQKETQTYKVLSALYSSEWECRVCGPVPEANPQPGQY